MQTQSGYSQADTREFMVYTDQHGREWEGWGDVKAKLHPTSPLRPLFEAPWLPDQTYMRFHQRKPGEFQIDYDAMIAESRRAHEARRDHILKVADHYNVNNFDPENENSYTAQMRREMGKGPLPTEPMLAARAGNGYVLGLRSFDPKRSGDQKLKVALDIWNFRPVPHTDGSEFADQEAEFADQPLEPVPVKRGPGRPRKVVTETPAGSPVDPWAEEG
jgi:hypothetical protein